MWGTVLMEQYVDRLSAFNSSLITVCNFVLFSHKANFQVQTRDLSFTLNILPTSEETGQKSVL